MKKIFLIVFLFVLITSINFAQTRIYTLKGTSEITYSTIDIGFNPSSFTIINDATASDTMYISVATNTWKRCAIVTW